MNNIPRPATLNSLFATRAPAVTGTSSRPNWSKQFDEPCRPIYFDVGVVSSWLRLRWVRRTRGESGGMSDRGSGPCAREVNVGMDLSCLGILKEDVQIYRYFLTHRGTGPDSVSAALGLDRDTVDIAINRLSRRKLLRLGNGQIAVTDPAIGMERLIEQRLTALNNTYQQLAAARETIKILTEEFANGQAHSRSADIERIEGLDEVRGRLDDLAFFTYHEVLGLQ